MLIPSKRDATHDDQAREIRRIETRNARIFTAFILGSALAGTLIGLAMLLRWRI